METKGIRKRYLRQIEGKIKRNKMGSMRRNLQIEPVGYNGETTNVIEVFVSSDKKGRTGR